MYLILILTITFCVGAYQVPPAEVELQPHGFTLKVKDVTNVLRVSFEANVNGVIRYPKTLYYPPINYTWPQQYPFTLLLNDSSLGSKDLIKYDFYIDCWNGSHTITYLQKYTTAPPEAKSSTTCIPSVTQFNGNQDVCEKQLIFEDHFSCINLGRWSYDIRFPGAPDYEFVVYTKEAFFNSPKGLEIKPTLLPEEFHHSENIINFGYNLGDLCTGIKMSRECSRKPNRYLILPPVVSGRLNTKNKFSFKYGKVEIRAKLPIGDWIYPELFLSPLSNEYGSHYYSGQIRVICLSQGTGLYGGIMIGDDVKYIRKYIKPLANGFHTYGVEWTPNFIKFSIDGNEFGEILPGSFWNLSDRGSKLWKSGTSIAPFDQEFYLDIGVGVGGAEFNEVENKPWKLTDPKALLKFWRSRESWYSTWGADSSLVLEYIKVYSL